LHRWSNAGANATTSVLQLATNSSTCLGWSLDFGRLAVDTPKLAWIGGTTQSVRGPVDNCEHDECQKKDKENKKPALPRAAKITKRETLTSWQSAMRFRTQPCARHPID